MRKALALLPPLEMKAAADFPLVMLGPTMSVIGLYLAALCPAQGYSFTRLVLRSAAYWVLVYLSTIE